MQILGSMEFMHSVGQLVSAKFGQTIHGSLTTEFSFCHLVKVGIQFLKYAAKI